MRKSIIIAILLVFLTVTVSQAYIMQVARVIYTGSRALLATELGKYIATSAAVHVAALGALIYNSLSTPSNTSHAVADNGNIGRQTDVVWTELKDNPAPQPDQLVTKASQAALVAQFNSIKSIVAGKLAKYPKLTAALTSPGYTQLVSGSPVPSGVTSGSTIKLTDGTYILLGNQVGYSTDACVPSDTPPSFKGPSQITLYYAYHAPPPCPTGSVHVTSAKDFQYQVVYQAPSGSEATPQQFKNNIAPTGYVTDSATRSEIDEAIKELENDNYSFNIIDGTPGQAASGSAPPASKPDGALTQQQILSKQTEIARDAAREAAREATNTAWKNYSSNKSLSNAHTYAQAASEQAKLESEAAKDEENENVAPNLKTPDFSEKFPAKPDGMSYADYIGVGRFQTVASRITTKWPFAYWSNLKQYLNNWTDGRGYPHFPISLSFAGNSHSWDLSLERFDPMAKLIRYMFALFGFLALGKWFMGFLRSMS